MSGHSKWNNIKRRKEKTDGQKAKIFTKIGREITVAIREGGADPSSNGKLRDLIAKAKSLNVPNDNIDRMIKKATGAGEKDNYEAIIYEGYGPCGVAVIVETLTDNRNRTAADLRHYFDKYGGNLGQTGCVSFMFAQKGVIVIDNEETAFSEEKIMEDCFDAGAVDFSIDEDDNSAEVFTDPSELAATSGALKTKGYKFISAEVEYVPSTYSAIDDPELAAKFEKLLDMLDDNDDVQNVWDNRG